MSELKINSQLLRVIEDKRNEIDEARRTFNVLVGSMLTDIFHQEVFDRFPHVESFTWSQYTPYFNDGDTCEFSVNTYPSSIQVNEKYLDDAAEQFGISSYQYDDTYPDEIKVFHRISDILTILGDDALLNAFGDHSEITFLKDGTHSIQPYEHD